MTVHNACKVQWIWTMHVQITWLWRQQWRVIYYSCYYWCQQFWHPSEMNVQLCTYSHGSIVEKKTKKNFIGLGVNSLWYYRSCLIRCSPGSLHSSSLCFCAGDKGWCWGAAVCFYHQVTFCWTHGLQVSPVAGSLLYWNNSHTWMSFWIRVPTIEAL